MFCLNSPEKGKRKLAGKRFAHEKALLCKDFDLIKANHNGWIVFLYIIQRLLTKNDFAITSWKAAAKERNLLLKKMLKVNRRKD